MGDVLVLSWVIVSCAVSFGVGGFSFCLIERNFLERTFIGLKYRRKIARG